MDSTFNRIDNGSVRWYNLDMPDAIEFRHRYIQPSSRCMDIARSMFDYAWLHDVDAPDGHVLILAGGLFQYFEEGQIRQLVCKIIEHFPSGELFFDTGSKRGVKITNRSVRKTGNAGSEMKFWVNNPEKLKEWSPGIRATETFPLLGEIARRPNLSFSTRLTMRICDRLGMVKLVSVQW
jgi:O-methyltransferase involved in polyketide biosynthesis